MQINITLQQHLFEFQFLQKSTKKGKKSTNGTKSQDVFLAIGFLNEKL
jgi:hypothetical protein